jgi:hypothetical protein
MGIDELRACEYWTEREGRAALSLLRRSGLSAAAFARRERLSRTRLLYWRSRLATGSTPTEVALAPVTVVEARRAGTIEIECLSGRVVRVEGDVDDALLARVIAASERAC